MMAFLGTGNSPMVGTTVAVAAAIEQASKQKRSGGILLLYHVNRSGLEGGSHFFSFLKGEVS